MNYLIMETHRSYAVVLDEWGVFHFAANLNYQVGERVQNPVLMDLEIPEAGQGDLAQAPKKKAKQEKKEETKAPTKVLPLEDKKEEVKERPKRRSWLPTLIAVAAGILIFIGGGYYYTNFLMTYSSIAVSINPDVSIDLNKRDEVIDVSGENPDGEALVDDFDLDSTDKNEVLRQLVQLAIDKGYLEDGVEVSVEATSRSKEVQAKYQSQAERALSAYLAGRVDATVNGQPVGSRSQPPAGEEDERDDDTGEADEDDDADDGEVQSQGTGAQTAPAQSQPQNTPPAQSQAPAPAQTQPRNPAPTNPRPAQSPQPSIDDDDDDDDDNGDDDDNEDDDDDDND